MARLAQGRADRAQALALRRQVFRGGLATDEDGFDARCQHLLVLEGVELVACARVLVLPAGTITASYSAQFYDLTPLRGFPGPVMELGRFCLRPGPDDPDILRMAWAALTHMVDAAGVTLLFGCSSFPGIDPAPHQAALAQLVRHTAPALWQPGAGSAERVAFPATTPSMAAMPPLLRSYLQLGAWVSDHAVIDRDLNTLHVFTGLEIAKVPAARARALRALVQG